MTARSMSGENNNEDDTLREVHRILTSVAHGSRKREGCDLEPVRADLERSDDSLTK